ncbi:MAG: glycosyltransferase family 1 protein [Acidobacteriota bacterium]
MRILIDYRPALKEPTGVGAYIHGLVLALLELKRAGDPDARGLDLTLFSSSWRDRLVSSAAAELTGARQADARIPGRLLNHAWHRLRWPPVESLAPGPFDVVHSATPVLLPARAGLRVSTICDLDFLHHPDRAWGEMRADFPRLAGEHGRAADLVVTISAYSANAIARELAIPEAKIVVCRPGVPRWIGSASPAIPREGGYILFVGTLEPRKNIPGLLDAYQRMLARWPDAPRLVIAGRPTPPAHVWIARASGEAFKGRVEIRGYLSDQDRLAAYRGAAVLVLPSFDEGFGLPALEAMALGVPVIVSNRGALPEVVGDAGLQVDPGDVEGLADAMRRVTTQPSIQWACQDAGLARAKAFDWLESARHLLQRYAEARQRRQTDRPGGAS